MEKVDLNAEAGRGSNKPSTLSKISIVWAILHLYPRYMDIRQLRTFLHVAELGSISLAADRLHIAQSALTRHIQSLEGELRVKLLTRHGRGVRLTPEGDILQARAAVVLREVESIREALLVKPEVLQGEVTFGMPPSVGDVLTVPLIEQFSARYPQVKLGSLTGASGYVLEWLQRGVIDLGFIYDVNQPSTVQSTPLTVEHLFFIERATPGSEAERTIPLHAALSRRLVLASRHHGLRQLLENVATTHGERIDTVAEADSVQVQIELVKRELGATILPYHSVAREVEAGTLQARLIESPHVTRKILIARMIDRPLGAAARQFMEMVLTEGPGLFPAGPVL